MRKSMVAVIISIILTLTGCMTTEEFREMQQRNARIEKERFTVNAKPGSIVIKTFEFDRILLFSTESLEGLKADIADAVLNGVDRVNVSLVAQDKNPPAIRLYLQLSPNAPLGEQAITIVLRYRKLDATTKKSGDGEQEKTVYLNVQ
ncbi:MAG TPA: hypothetical protein VFL04_02635 [Rectinemataceae bacterium]|nr:hypothetical protein [Rectinemataceae bacterium]